MQPLKSWHYSPKTLKIYRFWTQKFQTHTKSKDPRLVSVEDVKSFLTFLAVNKNISASSQNQAFNALLFLFRHVLEKDFGKVDGVVRAKCRRYIPVVLSRDEVDQVIRWLDYPYDLVTKLLYSFASHLLQANFDIRTIQALLGHSDVRTTMIYTHTVQSSTLKEAKSPLDLE